MSSSAIPWWCSIRTRIAVAVTGVAVLLIVSLGTAVDYWAAVAARERLRDQVRERLSSAVSMYQWRQNLTYGASLDTSSVPEPLLAELTQTGASASYYDGVTMWAGRVVDNDGTVLSVPYPADHLIAERSALRSGMINVAFPATIAAAILGWLAAANISARIRRTAAAATSVPAAVAAEQPVDLCIAGRDEVAALAHAIEDMAATLAHRYTLERRFSADVAHELRTPVTALVSVTELLPDDEAGRIARSSVLRLRALVEDLLELFRAESSPEPVGTCDIDLGAWVLQYLTESGHDVTCTVTDAALVRADPLRTERIVANLLTNAELHGSPPVTVNVSGSTLTVTDHGDGFSGVLLAAGPRRFTRDSVAPGSGLGLAIATALAGAQDATVRLANATHGGAAVSVTFTRSTTGSVPTGRRPGQPSRLPEPLRTP